MFVAARGTFRSRSAIHNALAKSAAASVSWPFWLTRVAVSVCGPSVTSNAAGEGTKMTMYVFSTAGEAVGFVYESFVYDLAGSPLGRILGSRVHRLDGSYVGEWFNDMVVDKAAYRRAINAVFSPPRKAPISRGVWRRSVLDHGKFPDAFGWLYDQPMAMAAE